MKLTDYVALFLQEKGIKHTFGLTGGAVVHFFDSIDKSDGIVPIFTHHEQSASFAAEAYARITNNLGACFVTTGPGGTNAITGLCAAWLDSIPCLFFSGQQRLSHTNYQKPIRQLGSQQIDIVTLVKSIAKYAVMLTSPHMIKYELQKATYIASTGRPGPVWIDIPLDMQWASIDPENIPSFYPEEENPSSKSDISGHIQELEKLLTLAKRPLILLGHGVRLAKGEELFRKWLDRCQIPVVSTWNTVDILPFDHKMYVGCAGIAAQRGANLAIQNCDLLLAIGSHLSMSITGTNFQAFARQAKKIIVNIDPIQLQHQTVQIDLPILADAKHFLEEISQRDLPKIDYSNWISRCRDYKNLSAIPQSWIDQEEYVNPYVFIDALSEELANTDNIVVDGGGTVLYMSFQALKIKLGQRMIVSGAIGAMGSGLPESIGAHFANGNRTICMVGDGSMQFNIQELQTIVHHNLPIKVFLFNNTSYLSIRQTQDGFLNSNYVGAHPSGGVSIPDYQKVVEAYGVKVTRVLNHKNLKNIIRTTLDEPGPVVCELMLREDQELIPRMGFKKHTDGTASGMPLEDMAPFLTREQFQKLMVIPPLAESLKN